MVDISQFTNVVALAILVGIVVQVFKAQIQAKYVPYFTIAVGIGIAIVLGVVQGHVAAPADLVSYVFGGFFAALLAIGGYESSIDKFKLS